MAITLGVRGTGSFSSDERPESWREGILLLFANGSTPVTGLTSKLTSKEVDDRKYHWFSKIDSDQVLAVSGAQLIGDTTIEVKNNLAKTLKRGHVVWNVTQNERVWVYADPTLDTEFSCIRNWDAAGGSAWVDDDVLIVLGSAYEEGEGTPTAQAFDPTENY